MPHDSIEITYPLHSCTVHTLTNTRTISVLTHIFHQNGEQLHHSEGQSNVGHSLWTTQQTHNTHTHTHT